MVWGYADTPPRLDRSDLSKPPSFGSGPDSWPLHICAAKPQLSILLKFNCSHTINSEALIERHKKKLYSSETPCITAGNYSESERRRECIQEPFPRTLQTECQVRVNPMPHIPQIPPIVPRAHTASWSQSAGTREGCSRRQSRLFCASLQTT